MAKSPIDVHTIGPGEKYKQAMLHQRVALCHVALFAQDLMKVAIALSEPVLEPAAGEQRFRMLTEGEVVNRAVKVAELAYAAFENKGWSAEVPSFNELLIASEDKVGFRGGE